MARMIDTTLPGERVKPGDPLYFEVLDFLWNEAELLDADRLDEWLELLDDDIRYYMPVRVTVYRRDGAGFVGNMAHFDEDLAALKLRVARVLNTTTAYAEDPPSRALRYVTNVRVSRLDESHVMARSYVLLVRSRWDNEHFEFLAAERIDRLRISERGITIAARDILVQQSRLGMTNLALFV
jgi:3-phenylpropionate/cinnamic acid dioxygenase small subunit